MLTRIGTGTNTRAKEGEHEVLCPEREEDGQAADCDQEEGSV